MKKTLIWVGSISVSLVLLLALIGYIAGPQKPEATKKETKQENGLERLNAILKKSDLSLCEVYHWVEDMEASTRKDTPDMTASDQIEHLEQLREKRWMAYCAKHNLDDTLKTYIGVYGFEQCK